MYQFPEQFSNIVETFLENTKEKNGDDNGDNTKTIAIIEPIKSHFLNQHLYIKFSADLNCYSNE
ncbi:MAG TPA: hypothetical protein VE573_18295 [Nitrososphaeraceae archaeon]|nr:hypothetical protein [Nitrososphaeraceae archaeon]